MRRILAILAPLTATLLISPPPDMYGRSMVTAFVDTCPPNIDFEFGMLQNWETNIGRVSGVPANLIQWSQASWLPNAGLPIRHELVDRNAGPALDYWGGFPVNPPNAGGRYALQLGTDKNDPTSSTPAPNALAEAVRYRITVPAAAKNYGIIFSYAVVFENPNHPDNLHTFDQQPRFIARMYEPGGDTVKCANFTFVASDPLPGFSISSKAKIDSASGRYPGGINYAPVKYKPWSSVYVNLGRYAGKTLFLEFITADCTKRGHFGYAYVDVLECVGPMSATILCSDPQGTKFIAPPGFKGYQWWNADFTRMIGTGDTLFISSQLRMNEKVNLRLMPFDSYGCEDTLSALVTVDPTPMKGIRYPVKQTIVNTNTPLLARGIGKSYLWSPPTGLDRNAVRNPIFRYDKDLEYLVQITTSNDCLTVDTQLVKVVAKADIFVPDAFSPNGDGKNDLLRIYPVGLQGLKFWVFNRWGQLMFETDDITQGWDGRFRGIPQPLETYVWVAEGYGYDGSIHRRRGQTVLIR